MKSLNKSTKILVAGIAIAGAVLVVGVLNTIRLERLTNELESACNAWAAKQQAPTVIDSPSPAADSPDLIEEKLKAKAQSRVRIEREYGKLSDAKIIARAKKEGVNPAEWPDLFAVRDKGTLAELERSSYTPQENAEEFAEAMNCDLGTLSSESKLTGIQAAIQRAYDEQDASKDLPNLAAAVLLGLGTIPWFWYFLLRRIADLCAAIGGKPPVG